MTVHPLGFLRGLAMTWIAMVVILIVCRAVISFAAGRLEAKGTQARRSLGLPEVAVEYRSAIPAESNNGVRLFELAESSLNESLVLPTSGYRESYLHVPYPQVWHNFSDASKVANARAISLAILAGKVTEGGFGFDPASAFSDATLESKLRRFGHGLLCVAKREALRRHFSGDDAGYFEIIEALRNLSYWMEQEPLVLTFWHAAKLEDSRVDTMIQVAARLEVGSSAGGVSQDRVREEMKWLLGRPMYPSPKHIVGEGTARVNAFKDAMNRNWLLKPVFRTAAAEGVLLSTRDLVSLFGGQLVDLKEVASDLSLELFDGMDYVRVRESCERSAALRGRCVIALAIALYRSDHSGAWPESQADLMPGYLGQMPSDPHGGPGDRLVYRLASLASQQPVPIGVPSGTRPVILGRNAEFPMLPLPKDEELPPGPIYDPWADMAVWDRRKVRFVTDLALFRSP